MIAEYMETIRDLNNLSSDSDEWFRFCASMDVIEDSELAINSFSNKVSITEMCEVYLLVFGLFQSIFQQQDAIITLNKCVGFQNKLLKDYSDLKEIREIRNAVGHSTNKYKDELVHFLSRSSLTLKGFPLEYERATGDSFS